jgi:hypothetical protein
MMHVARRNPSAAVSGAQLAADAVEMVRQAAGIGLDYTPSSLADVDRIIGSIRCEDPPADADPQVVLRFGAYTGEVLVRTAKAVWVNFDAAQRDAFGQPFGVRTSDGRLCDPLGKVVERFEVAASDSLQLFYLSVVGRGQA